MDYLNWTRSQTNDINLQTNNGCPASYKVETHLDIQPTVNQQESLATLTSLILINGPTTITMDDQNLEQLIIPDTGLWSALGIGFVDQEEDETEYTSNGNETEDASKGMEENLIHGHIKITGWGSTPASTGMPKLSLLTAVQELQPVNVMIATEGCPLLRLLKTRHPSTNKSTPVLKSWQPVNEGNTALPTTLMKSHKPVASESKRCSGGCGDDQSPDEVTRQFRTAEASHRPIQPVVDLPYQSCGDEGVSSSFRRWWNSVFDWGLACCSTLLH